MSWGHEFRNIKEKDAYQQRDPLENLLLRVPMKSAGSPVQLQNLSKKLIHDLVIEPPRVRVLA